MASGIYQIRNILNSKVYIGSTADLDMRNIEHFRYLRGGYHVNQKLQHAYDKHGGDAFVFEILEITSISRDELFDLEQEYLDRLNFRLNYNIAQSSRNPMYGIKHTEDSKRRMSINSSGEKNPMFGMKGVLAPGYGRKHTDDVKKMLSETRAGSGNTMYGKSGSLSPTSKKVIVDGTHYDSLTIAGDALGIGRKTVANRIKSEKYPGYSYV